MINFRQNSIYSDCLIYGDINPIDTLDDEVIAYIRYINNEKIYCYFNFGSNSIRKNKYGSYKLYLII